MQKCDKWSWFNCLRSEGCYLIGFIQFPECSVHDFVLIEFRFFSKIFIFCAWLSVLITFVLKKLNECSVPMIWLVHGINFFGLLMDVYKYN